LTEHSAKQADKITPKELINYLQRIIKDRVSQEICCGTKCKLLSLLQLDWE